MTAGKSVAAAPAPPHHSVCRRAADQRTVYAVIIADHQLILNLPEFLGFMLFIRVCDDDGGERRDGMMKRTASEGERRARGGGGGGGGGGVRR